MARRMNAAWLAAIGTGLMMMAAQAHGAAPQKQTAMAQKTTGATPSSGGSARASHRVAGCRVAMADRLSSVTCNAPSQITMAISARGIRNFASTVTEASKTDTR